MKNFFTLLFVSLFTVLAASAEDTYVVAGVEVMMGSNWKGADADNQMTSSDGGETYTLVKEGVKLEAGIAYEYKIVKNGNTWMPEENQKVTVGETGIYTVTFTFVVAGESISYSTVKTGNAEATKHTYSVIGTFVDEWATDFDMTESPEGTWTAVITGLAAGNYQFKVRADRGWDINYPSSDYQLTVEADNTTVTIVFIESTKEISVSQTVVPTSIDKVNAADDNAPVYNFAGMRAKKGLVIKNNKKYILK